MKERPILFGGEMVRAILAGRKTQTRRVVRLNIAGRVMVKGSRQWHLDDPNAILGCPYGLVGDRLWVRETHYVWKAGNIDGSGRRIDYRATEPGAPCTWTPSIHMPRWASRITLEVTEVRLQRLQDISHDDCEAEGWPGPDADNSIRSSYPMAWYSHLWDSINGKRVPWLSNPSVWALTFEVVK